MTNRKLYMRFRLTPRSMTLDDLELYISLNFQKILQISDATTAIRMKIDHQRQRCQQLNVLFYSVLLAFICRRFLRYRGTDCCRALTLGFLVINSLGRRRRTAESGWGTLPLGLESVNGICSCILKTIETDCDNVPKCTCGRSSTLHSDQIADVKPCSINQSTNQMIT